MACRWLWCLGRGPPVLDDDGGVTNPAQDAAKHPLTSKLSGSRDKVPVGHISSGLTCEPDGPDEHTAIKAVRTKHSQLLLDSPAAYHDSDLDHVFQQAQSQLQAVSTTAADAMPAPATMQELQQLQEMFTAAAAAGTLDLSQTAQRLHAFRHWLSNGSSCSVSAADNLLKSLLGALQQLEDQLLQAPTSNQWTTGQSDVCLALLQLYAAFTHQALNPRPHAKPLRVALAQLLLARPQPMRLAAALLDTMLQQHNSSRQSSQHTSASVPQSYVLLWDVVLAFFKFASLLQPCSPVTPRQPDQSPSSPSSTMPDVASHQGTGCDVHCSPAAVIKQSVTSQQATIGGVTVDVHAWALEVQHLARQPDGPLSIMLSQPFKLPHAAGQLAGQQALKQMYTLQQMQLLQQDIAGTYAAMHYHSLLQHYHAAGRDPRCAAAKLCALNLGLLRAAVATGSVAARLALQQAGAVDWLLSQFALESQLYSEEQARAAEENAAAGSETDSDMGSEVGLLSPTAGPARTSPPRHSRNSRMQLGAKPGKFVFTYDLNEDVERLMALEERTGQSVELDGLEYDDEAKQLMARSPYLMPLPPLIPTDGTSPLHASRNLPPLRLNQSPSHMLASRLLSDTSALVVGGVPASLPVPAVSDSGLLLLEPHKPSVPRLALGSLRSAASSRIATPLRLTPPDNAGTPPGASRHKGSLSLRSRASKSGVLTSLHSQQSEQPALDQQPAYAPHQRQAPVSSRSAGTAGEVLLTPGPLTSSRLHHSHLSPLSARSSNAPPGPTHVVNILLNQSHNPPSSSRGAASSRMSARMEATGAYSSRSAGIEMAMDHSSVKAKGAKAVLLDQGQVDEAMGRSFTREATCALPDAPPRQQATDTAVSMGSEGWDKVPDLQPRPPAQPHPGPAGQSLGHRGLNGDSSRPVPSLNLVSLNSRTTSEDRSGRRTGSQRGAVSSHRSTLPTHSTMADSAMNPHHLVPSSASTSPAALNPFADQHCLEGGSAACSSPGHLQPLYLEAVQALLWFHDAQLHAQLLHLLLSLLVKPSGALDSLYIQAFPADAGSPNVEHQLTWHFAGPAASAVLPHLVQLLNAESCSSTVGPASAAGQNDNKQHASACLRLLRLLARQLLACDRYTDLVFHSRGAYGAVYKAKLQDPNSGTLQHVMVKAIELPGSGFDRCVLPDVFGEVSILQRYSLHLFPPASTSQGTEGSQALCTTTSKDMLAMGTGSKRHADRRQACMGICQLHDYGLAQGAYWLVMRRYRCTLAEWRARQPCEQGPAATAMYLSVLQQVIESMEVLAADAVVHFDLKASNVLVDPLEGVKDSQLYGPAPPPPCVPCFRPVLADFGEARAYHNCDEAFTARNRGTEVYKSPEMLLMHAALRPSNPGTAAGAGIADEAAASQPSSYNGATAGIENGSRQSRSVSGAATGAGLASDVWSFGLLAYELLSGHILFSEADYASVTHRVAFGAGAALALSKPEVEALGSYGASHLGKLVEWILVRDPAHRPSLRSIHDRLAQIREYMLQQVATAGGK